MGQMLEKDYRAYLRNELSSRTARNTRYSLRAFARDLGISPNHLSSILSGKKGLSYKMGEKISLRMELNAEERKVFLELLTVSLTRTPKEPSGQPEAPLFMDVI